LTLGRVMLYGLATAQTIERLGAEGGHNDNGVQHTVRLLRSRAVGIRLDRRRWKIRIVGKRFMTTSSTGLGRPLSTCHERVMRAGMCRLLVLLLVALAFGCSGMRGQPFDPSLSGREFYLCCNIRFNPELRAADSNYGTYLYQRSYLASGPTLAAGTRVRVVKVGSSGVALEPLGGGGTYTIEFGYGRKQETPAQYFSKILRTTNPMDDMKDLSPQTAAAIREGRLVEGMTKAQALIARSYPPAHRTPSLEANEWIYYETPGKVDRVVFADGRIKSITLGPAPE
jgi:hypothetical protein